ncbi:WD repeat-containing protein mip1 [Cyphellophora attinorum]|uniref:WD repeat-containing protein mip1 n=1 Tax=Cyphellophora attinorum TaxID=1664694 RepID=A0A0N0NJJ1_9EURO|nr:WD repeat-containing protein mip1 [Phialophora attinorum]KPI37031.1 WD repeat-containing protein mip1 [Phialophora attinorum]
MGSEEPSPRQLPSGSFRPTSNLEARGSTDNGWTPNYQPRQENASRGMMNGNGPDHNHMNDHTNGYRPDPPGSAPRGQRLAAWEHEAAIRQRPPFADMRSESQYTSQSGRRRANSDGPPSILSRDKNDSHLSPDDRLAHIRHGWDSEQYSDEYLSLLNDTFYMYYTEKRHESSGNPSEDSKQYPNSDWRMKDRMKTVSAALALCLNIGVDPPDVIKTSPTAKLEAWLDPSGSNGGSTKMMEQIGKRLQEQYETLSLRTRYKQYLDPAIEETKRFCVSLRRNAKDERVLFHYNGHGVPLPTASGELWVFNKNYTQYIPIGVYDLQSWLAGPSLFVYDVSHAGNILHNFDTFIVKHEKENEEIRKRDPQAAIQNYSDCIQLAACGRNEMLPTNPDLPADLFTCCLTTPIDIALRWFVLQNPLPTNVEINDSKIPIPGRLQDRRSPLGELNWIFTAITDTIAWNTLPRALFKKLFRQDLLVAALFRNFLLSDRIMRANHCHPQSSPPMPETHHHPLWQSWDLAVDNVLTQLPALIEADNGKRLYEYEHSNFFAEQLTAFEVYLSSGPTKDHAPDQLPIVLQVLLSQVHRLRALILLSKFLDLGPWAVHLALSIGIFPYVLKLLQAASIELKPVMVFIWARIMAVDSSVHAELLKDNGIHYFVTIMVPQSELPVANASEHRAMCSFIVATFCRGFPQGQTVCLLVELVNSCLENMLEPENPLLRQWSCLCLSTLWADYTDAKWMGIRQGAHLRLCELAVDPVPEVRAAMLHTLTSFLGIPDLTDQIVQIEEDIAASVLFMTADGSTLVRKELLVFLSVFVKRHQNKFLIAALEQLEQEVELQKSRGFADNEKIEFYSSGMLSSNTIYGSVWAQIAIMSVDPNVEVSRNATAVVDHVHDILVNSPLRSKALSAIDELLRLSRRKESPMKRTPSMDSMRSLKTPVPRTPTPQVERTNSYLSLGSLKRTASSLRHLAFGTPTDTTTAESTPVTSPAKSIKPTQPKPPAHTPRGQLPAEWSQAPTTEDQSASGSYHQSPVPRSAGARADNTKEQLDIPLTSKLFEWSTEYFREPQMRAHDPDEPGSEDYNSRLWRRTRNEITIADTQPLKSVAGSSRWTRLEASINNNSQPMNMTFHQFDDTLAITDDKDGVTIWDCEKKEQLNRFSNNNPEGTRINDARFMNEDDHNPLLMVGSSDGVLKVYRHYNDPEEVSVVAAWRALTELLPSNRNAGLVFDWQQGQGRVLAAGDMKIIKIWNAATELCVADIPARSGSCVTSLTSDQVAGDVFVAGFGDGVVRVFDQRMHVKSSMVKIWREHHQWVTNVKMQRGGTRELVSASRNGEVKLWDLRNDKSILSFNVLGERHSPAATGAAGAINGDAVGRDVTLRTLSVHEHAPVFAVGTDKREVKSFSTTGQGLGVFDPSSGGGKGLVGSVGGGRRSNAIVATAYHPHKMVLACAGWGNGNVSLVGY